MPATAPSLLVQALDQSLDALPAGVGTLAAALSGGPDSSALAILAAERAALRGVSLHLFHVHHGLFEAADGWAAHAQGLARKLGLPFHLERVTVESADPRGIEAAARSARYEALARMARRAGVAHILLGHHLDDQAETVMLRLLRGAGVEGMGAMAPTAARDGIVYLRPWLRVGRALILNYMRARSPDGTLDSVEDPSNLDVRFGRGALRRDVLPAIERHWPGYRFTLERFARLAAESAAVLREVAAADLESLREDLPSFENCLRVSGLAALSEPRRMMVLRAWLGSRNAAMPSEARLQELARQLRFAAPDRQVLLQHGDLRVRRYRDWVIAERDEAAPGVRAEHCTIQWSGEASVRVDAFAGMLSFHEVGEGLDPEWLRQAPLSLRWRRGREKLRLNPQSPSRSLKNLYQELGIPSWERERLPLVYRLDKLVFAAGLGSDVRMPRAAPGIGLEWLADRPGATFAG